MERLKEIVQIIARPLNFAERAGPVALKDLGRFISHQVSNALGEGERSPMVEAELLRLVELFSDYDELPTGLRAARVTEAHAVIARLEQAVAAVPASGRGIYRLWDCPIQFVRGVGPKKAEALARFGIRTVEDAVWSLPWRYEDRSRLLTISSLVPGESAMIEAQVERIGLKVTHYQRRKLVEVVAADRTGRLHLIWFNQGYLAETFQVGQRLMLYGQAKPKNGRWTELQMENPVFEILDNVDMGPSTACKGGQGVSRTGLSLPMDAPLSRGPQSAKTGSLPVTPAIAPTQPWSLAKQTPFPLAPTQPPAAITPPRPEPAKTDSFSAGTRPSPGGDLTHMGRIVPIYHGRETVSRMMVSDRLRAMMKIIVDQYARSAVDPLPVEMLRRHRLLSFSEAIQQVHFPPPGADLVELNRGRSPAHRRLAFEDFLLLELALGQKREQVRKESRVLRYDLDSSLPAELLKMLPFRLTTAQVRVLHEIRGDLASPHPMNRLIQGDVGSGKTVVALLVILAAVGSGHQAAFMAPTEILAEQHYRTLERLLKPLNVSCLLLTGGRGTKRRKAALEAIAEGSASIVLGTHALIQQDVRFRQLGLAVIDEQHKFGVLQRGVLKEKGYAPDVLVMTATPIPRTLALTVYGDLDVSVIDAMPPGRRPVRTLLFAESQRARIYRLVEEELSRGRQAYIVFPLVEESAKVDLQAAMTGAERLQRNVFPKWKVGLIHGRMRADEKDQVMRLFKEGRMDVLVATTVIEVGIDIPNAGVMVIEHADRFGLAQLHQLRGRVGRGLHQSYCLLVAPSRLTEEGRRRLEALVKTNDGFMIAEEDMAIRGPGEFFGTRQWGPADLRVANLIRDAKILEEAREESARLYRDDPELGRPEHAELKAALLRRWHEKLDLARIS